jgi:hypothetical protein
VKPSDLAPLRRLAGAVFEAELARMRGNRARAAAVAAQVADLRQARRDRGAEKGGLDAPDTALLASADLHWDRWTDERLRRLQAERARIEAEAAALRAGARTAFGRREALAGLSVRLATEARRKGQHRG